MLHPIEVNQDQKDSDAQKQKGGSKEKIAPSPSNHNPQTGHCGATGTMKK